MNLKYKLLDKPNIEKYVKNIANKKDFIFQHFMKLYFYNGYNESTGLHNSEWTKVHWFNEIMEILSPITAGFKFDKIEFKDLEKFKEAVTLNISEKKKAELFTMFMKGDTGDYHDLPKLTEKELNGNFNNALTTYQVFTVLIARRLRNRGSNFNFDNLQDILREMIDAKTTDTNKLDRIATSIKFSQRYELLMRWLTTDEDVNFALINY